MPPRGAKPMPGGDVERTAAQAGATGTVVAMAAPDDLTEDARGLWDVILPDLIALKVFRVSDAPMLAELCSSLSYARSFRAEMDMLTIELAKTAERLAALPRPAATDEDKESLKQAHAEYEYLSLSLKRARSGYTQMMRTAMNLAGDFAVSPVSRLRLGLMVAKGNTLGALREAIEKGETVDGP